MSESQEKILAFDNKFHEFGTQIVTGTDCVISPFPIIDESENYIFLTLTGSELREILSSIEIGSQWAYPDKSQQILFNFMKGLICMSFCEEIANCLDDPESPATIAITNISEETSNTLIENNNTIINQDRNLTPDESGFLEKRFKSIDREEPVLDPSGSCDDDRKDEIYAGTLEIVNRISEMGQDFLEDVNAQADSVQRAARAVAIIPIIGDLAGETILAFAEVIPDILDLFLSHDSIAQREDVACDLFCLHADECGYPTFDELIDYYKSVGIGGVGDIADISMTALVDAVLGTNGLAATVVWHAMNAFVLYFMYVESAFLGRRGKKWIQIYAGNGELLPNNDWMILCDDCAPEPDSWQWSYALNACTYGLPTGWTINIGTSVCGVSGGFQGIRKTTAGTSTVNVIRIYPTHAQAIYEVHASALCNLVSGFNDGSLRVEVYNGATQVYDSSQVLPRTEYTVHNYTPNVIGDQVVITGYQTFLSSSPTGVAVRSISINDALL